DLFAFCVALYQGLYGERPFEGATAAELIIAIGKRQVRKPAEGRAVPGWLRRALLLGLSPERDARHASMEALLTVLDRQRARRLWPLTAAAALSLAAASLAVAGTRAQGRPC